MRSRLYCFLICFFAAFGFVRGAEARLVTVSLDFRNISSSDFEQLKLLSFQQKLLLRLTQSGYAVIGARFPADIRILTLVNQKHILLVVTTTKRQERKKILRTKQSQLSQLHLECLHKSMAAVQVLRRQLPKAKPAKRSRKKVPPRRKPKKPLVRKNPKKPKAFPNPWHFSLQVGGAWFYRLQGSDPLLQVGVRWGRVKGLGLRMVGQFSFSAAEALSVIEWGALVGPSWRLWLSKRFYMEPGILFGIMHHIYTFEQGQNAPKFHLDFVGELQWLVGWQIASTFALQLWLGAGFAHQSRTHAVDPKAPLWNRSLFRLQVGGLLSFQF